MLKINTISSVGINSCSSHNGMGGHHRSHRSLWDSDFVPEGQNDRSQAIYCLETVQSGIRPVGNGVTLIPG
jgi:hypothetical protein